MERLIGRFPVKQSSLHRDKLGGGGKGTGLWPSSQSSFHRREVGGDEITQINPFFGELGWLQPTHLRSSSRHGSVLLVVLVVIALLALGAYSFSELMVSESHATGVFGREAQARAAADSGVELAAAVLGLPTEEGAYENVVHDPQNFVQTIKEANGPRGRTRFSLVAPNESDVTCTTIRFGLIDESSKLNVNALVAAEQKQQSRGTSLTSGSGATGGSTTSTGASGSTTASSGTTGGNSTSASSGSTGSTSGSNTATSSAST